MRARNHIVGSDASSLTEGSDSTSSEDLRVWDRIMSAAHLKCQCGRSSNAEPANLVPMSKTSSHLSALPLGLPSGSPPAKPASDKQPTPTAQPQPRESDSSSTSDDESDASVVSFFTATTKAAVASGPGPGDAHEQSWYTAAASSSSGPVGSATDAETREELHLSGRCKPCSFVNAKRGCNLGDQCDFCHLPHKRWSRPSASRRWKAKKDAAEAAVGNAVALQTVVETEHRRSIQAAYIRFLLNHPAKNALFKMQ